MPKYKTRKIRAAIKRRNAAVKVVPRDKRMLMRWARKGTAKDYDKLRELAGSKVQDAPNWVDAPTLEKLSKTGHRGLQELIKNQTPERPSDEQPQYFGGKIVHKVTDALSWLISTLGGGKRGPAWLTGLPQYALKPFRGEQQTEVDEQYARLISGGYRVQGTRPDALMGWKRVPKWDSNYVSVWDNPDGHRFVSVRGTKPHKNDLTTDLVHDASIAARGTTSDVVGPQLQRILDDTEPSRIVDVGGHSLGTVLILQAYQNNKDLQSRIHTTRLYNPAYNPQLLLSHHMPSVAKEYEQDPRVRYLINLGDVVSMGGWGGEGPKNVVYRTPIGNTIHWSETGGGLDPLHLHQLRQWQGPYWDGLPDYEPELSPEDTALPQSRLDEMQKPWRPEPQLYSGGSGLDVYNTNELAPGNMEETGLVDFGDDEDFLDDLRQRLGNF